MFLTPIRMQTANENFADNTFCTVPAAAPEIRCGSPTESLITSHYSEGVLATVPPTRATWTSSGCDVSDGTAMTQSTSGSLPAQRPRHARFGRHRWNDTGTAMDHGCRARRVLPCIA
jgi:hypothetical protein